MKGERDFGIAVIGVPTERLPTLPLARPTETDCGDGTCGCGCGFPVGSDCGDGSCGCGCGLPIGR